MKKELHKNEIALVSGGMNVVSAGELLGHLFPLLFIVLKNILPLKNSYTPKTRSSVVGLDAILPIATTYLVASNVLPSVGRAIGFLYAKSNELVDKKS